MAQARLAPERAPLCRAVRQLPIYSAGLGRGSALNVGQAPSNAAYMGLGAWRGISISRTPGAGIAVSTARRHGRREGRGGARTAGRYDGRCRARRPPSALLLLATVAAASGVPASVPAGASSPRASPRRRPVRYRSTWRPPGSCRPSLAACLTTGASAARSQKPFAHARREGKSRTPCCVSWHGAAGRAPKHASFLALCACRVIARDDE